MSDLTTELQRMADEAACQAKPLDAADVIRQGDRRRQRSIMRRSLGGLSVTGVAVTVLVLTLAGVFSPGSRTVARTIRTAAFTLTRNANGTDTLTISPQVISEPSTLQSDLAQYDIPAVVNAGSFCTSSPAPDGFSQVVTFSPPLTGSVGYQQIQHPTITIDPSAMPTGTELSFGIFQPSTALSPITAIALIDTNSNTCASTTPATLPPGGALLHVPAGS